MTQPIAASRPLLTARNLVARTGQSAQTATHVHYILHPGR